MPGTNGRSRMTASMRWLWTARSAVPEDISIIAFPCLRFSVVEAPQCVLSVPITTTEGSRAVEAGLELHRCGVCAYWERALTHFGEPSGKGDSRFPRRSTEGSRSYIAESKSDKR